MASWLSVVWSLCWPHGIPGGWRGRGERDPADPIRDRLPPGLLRDLVDTLARHGHHIPPTDVLPALITLLHAGGHRTGTQLIFARLVATYQRPDTEFVRGEQFGRIDDLAIITGRGHAGIRSDAEHAAI